MKNEWLPHLENAVPTRGYGNRLSMYLIALEAWRRGLVIKFYQKKNPENKMLIRYSISNNENEYKFESSRGEKLSEKAYQICENKDDTKNLLSKIGLPVPLGKRFKSDVNDYEIIEYARELTYPVVIKPVGERAGKGVFSNIKNESTLKKLLFHVRYELGYKDIILEQHISGNEHRILVVNNKVVGVVKRVPANIIGDGKHTVNELVQLKNKSRKSNPSISKKPIKIDQEVLDFIKAQGHTLDSVPKKGEQLLLRGKSNVSMGGDAIDVTDLFPNHLKDMALKAVNSVPGLYICGLDMIVDTDYNWGVIIEMNTKPMIGLHIFPVEGTARDVVKPILDLYFPETIGKPVSNFYFDFDAVLSPLKARIVNEIELIPPSIRDKTYGKRYLLKGENIDFGFRNMFRREALKLNIHGYIKELDRNTIEIVIVHEEKEILDKIINNLFSYEIDIEIISKENYDKPIKIGFENYSIPLKDKIKKRMNNMNKKLNNQKVVTRNLKNALKNSENRLLELKKQLEHIKLLVNIREKENKHLQTEVKQLEKQYKDILNSRSWKITKPFRSLVKFIKR